MGPLKSVLPSIMKQVLTNRPVKFTRFGFGGYKANLGNGITAKVVAGGSEYPTKVYLTDGTSTLKKEIRECWLENWQVIKNIKVDH